VYQGMGIVNSILTSKTKVIGHCPSMAMSMGLAIFAVCHERVAYPCTNFMFHELSSAVSGRAEEIKRATQEYDRLQKMYDNLLIKRTNLTQTKLNNIKKKSTDWYFDAFEAKKFGLVDEIIGEDLLK
jgi:ATP-dependent protease ClpP protease subunit